MKGIRALSKVQIIIYTIILGVVASILHFSYELTGKILFVGLLNPVNESVWEHLKLMFFPFLLWWIVIYYFKNEKCSIPLSTWIVSAAVSLVVAPLSVVLLFYTYTGALGIESVYIDIFLAFISYLIALCIGSHFFKYSRPSKWTAFVSLILIAIIFIAFIIFTINPPQLPIFLV